MTSRDPGEVMIEVDHLSRNYGPAPALQEVSFRAYRGEIVGFLGPNGAGKTTTMRILTGYLPPTSGRAFVAGHDVVTESMAARKAVGYLPETTPIYPEMSVWGYLDFMARLHGVSDRASAIERAMEKVDLSDRADQLISRLSKGLRQRVGIAQAVLHDPPVIILDEPTIGLDPRQIREVRSLIEELRGDHTVILSTHILPEAQQICDRVLIINRGRLVAEDTPDELTSRLSGGQRVRLATAPELASEAVRATLGDVSGVDAVVDVGPGIYHIDLTAGEDARPALAKAIVGQDWPLLEMVPVGMSLEDIFLELTRDAAEEDYDEGFDAEDVGGHEMDGSDAGALSAAVMAEDPADDQDEEAELDG